jgi:translation initiation factor IF-2
LKKLRVFELAKDFGMKGPELAKLLRDLGFENIKTHMTALDDADQMMILARLEAQGLKQRPEGHAEPPAALPKKKLPFGEETELAPETGPAHAPARRELKELPKKQLPKVPVKKKRLDEVEDTEGVAELQPEPRTPGGPGPEARPQVEETHVRADHDVATVEATPAAATEPEAPAPREAATHPAEAPAADLEPEAAAAHPVPELEPAPVEPVPVAPAAGKAAPTEPAPTETLPAGGLAPAPEAAAGTVAPDVKRLLVPQQKAAVVGRIELTKETIRDATRRSAPATERDLRRAALIKTQQRSASRSATPMSGRRGPSTPAQRGPTRGDAAGRPGTLRKGKVGASVVDPSRVIEIAAPISIKALSEALGTKVTELISTLTFKLKVPGKNINSFLTNDEAELVALELGRQIKIVEAKEAEDEMIAQLVEESASEAQILRAPVVTFMGHVDHGKTSLLDALRNSDVAKHEAGGITQHIGAYKVTNEKGRSIVVLDTPGHAAFTAMRARGANLTDVVVLVVAADDGVMPQTEEALNHALAAKVPIVVAINKCDLPGANPMQVKQQLMVKGLQPEEWGGETGMLEVSAVTKQGLDELVDRIMLEAEVRELKARPDAGGKGIVVESRQSPQQGVVVTVLVTDGTLRLKDPIVCGESFARVRAMIDDHGRNLQEAGPSTPVTLFGLDTLPTPGDKLFVVEDAKKAREVVEERQRRIRQNELAEQSAVTLETLSQKLAEKNIQEIKIILKADAMGSLEPLRKCLEELSTPEVRVNLVHSGLGGINETDVRLAQASNAVIVGFNTIADSSARTAAERAGVEIRYYDVIYELLDQVRAAMEGMLAPEEIETILGHAEVKAIFKSSKFGAIAGCIVRDGVARRNAKVRLSRDGAVVHTGKVASLRREKEDVREVKAGFECGMTLQDYQDIHVGDVLEFALVELKKRTLGG